MPVTQQFLVKEERQETIIPASFFKRMGMLFIEPNARKILITYLDSQNFYKVSPDVLFFRKKLENFILFLAKTVAIHRNHDFLEPRDMKIALVVYFHLITTRDITTLLNLDQIDATGLFNLHQAALYSFYRNLVQERFTKEGRQRIVEIEEKMKRLLENIGELKKKSKKEILEQYLNAIEIMGFLNDKENPGVVLTKRMIEKSQYLIQKFIFDSTLISDIEILYNLYRLLKNAELLMNLCSIEIPWEIQKILKIIYQKTEYFKADLRISKILKRKNFFGLEYNRQLVLNFIQFLSTIYALKQNIYINKDLFEIIFPLFDKLVITQAIEQIEHIQIHIFPNWKNPTEYRIQDFFFTTFKKGCTKNAKDYLLRLKKLFAHLLIKHMGRKELLLNHPKFVIQIITALVFLAYRNAYFMQHSKVDQSDVKVAFNQLCYLLLDAKFGYLE